MTSSGPTTEVADARPLVAEPLRRPLLVVAGAGVLVFAGLGVLVADRRGPVWFDRELGPVLIGFFRGRSGLARQVADLGGLWWYLTLTVLTTGFWLARRHLRAAVLAAVAPLIAVGLTDLAFKPLVHRTKAYGDAFPSGHTTSICAIALALVLTVAASGAAGRGGRALRVGVSVVAVGVSVSVAIALVAAGYHFVTDTIGGVLVAAVTVIGTALAVDALAPRAGRDVQDPGLTPP